MAPPPRSPRCYALPAILFAVCSLTYGVLAHNDDHGHHEHHGFVTTKHDGNRPEQAMHHSEHGAEMHCHADGHCHPASDHAHEEVNSEEAGHEAAHVHGEGCSHHHEHSEAEHHHDHDHAQAHGRMEDGHSHGHEEHEHHSREHEHGSCSGHAHAAAPAQEGGSSMRQYPLTAITLTVVSGGASALGGVLVVLLGTPSPRLLGHLLSFAAGIMLYVSYADLLPHAVAELSGEHGGGETGHAHCHGGHGHGHSHEGHGHEGPGFWTANVWMLGGMALFGLMCLAVPDGGSGGDDDGHGHSHGIPAPALPAPGAGSGSGSSDSTSATGSEDGVVTAPEAGPRQRRKRAGTETEPVKKPAAARKRAAAADAAPGASAVAAPSPKATAGGLDKRRLWMTGLMAAVGITLHNLPEGLIVYNQTLGGLCQAGADGQYVAAAPGTIAAWLGFPADLRSCLTRGAAVTMAIALHNIPEGMAVASPIYASTGSAWRAIGLTLLSSAAEPLAAVVFGVFFSSWITPALMSRLNAGVAGIMIALCIGELMPAAAATASPKAAVFSNIAGQAVMFASLHAMRAAGLH